MAINMERNKIREMVLMSLFTALVAVGAFIKIPFVPVPFTLQFFFTLMAGLVLGGRMGWRSVALYVLLGLIGLPIFAAGGGPAYVLKPSFGYLPGFILAAAWVGTQFDKLQQKKLWKIFLINFVGLLIVYGCGVSYLYLVNRFVLHTPLSVFKALKFGFLVFLPGDSLSCAVAAVCATKLLPLLSRPGEKLHQVDA